MKRGDWIVLAALLALAGGLLLLRVTGGGTEIYINGEPAIASVTVNEVAIEIDGTRARVTSSPCRDKLCVHAGWLDKPGELAICLPQRVIVELRGGGTGERKADGIAY